MNIINSYRFGAGTFNGFGNASRAYTSGDYIDMGDVLDSEVWAGATSFTIAMWVKASSIASEPIVMSKLVTSNNTRQFYFRILNTGAISGIVYNDGNTSGYRSAKSTATSVTNNTWHHIVMTCDQSQIDQLDIFDFYIDGAQTNATTWLAVSSVFDGMDDLSSPVQLSGVINGTVAPFVGNMADVRVYSKILSATEVSDLYTGVNVSDSLEGWWITDVDDGTTTITDYAGANDGTNNGTTYDTDGPNG